VPIRRDRLFARILQPAIDVCLSLGIAAEWRPPADITADHRKCSGNAAGDIAQAVVYVGNLILDFDYEAMSRVLKAPTAGFRRQLRKAMEDNMLTLAGRMAGRSIHALESGLAASFERHFGQLRERFLDDEMRVLASSIRNRLTSDDWLSMPGRHSSLRRIKIAEGIYLQETKEGDSNTALLFIRNGRAEKKLLNLI
jgi:lipoate---protein ligase